MSTEHILTKDIRIVLLGAGGHAKVLLDALESQELEVVGIVDPVLAERGGYWRGIPVLGRDDDLLWRETSGIVLVNGLGSLPGSVSRQSVFAKFKAAGYRFINVVHPSVLIGSGVELGEGAQLMAGSLVQADTIVGDNSIVNTGALIDHDCVIGRNVHIAPGAVVSGGVHIGEGVHIGVGASIIQGVSIGAGSVVGAGTAVVKDVPDRAKILGAPSRVSQI